MKTSNYLLIIILIICFAQAKNADIQILIGNTPIDTLTWQNNTFSTRLFYFGKDSLHQAKVVVRTVNKKDCDTVILPNIGLQDSAWIFEGENLFKVTTNTAVNNNDTTEADLDDLVTLHWQHPKFSNITAFDTALVYSPPNNIKIYDKLGDPASVTMNRYHTSPDTSIVLVGDTVQLFAKVFKQTKWLREYETNSAFGNKIRWSFVDVATNRVDTTVGNLANSTGNNSSFFPKKGAKRVDLTASLKLPGLPTIQETIRLFIHCNSIPVFISIEASRDSTMSPWDPAPYNPITLTYHGRERKAYAIIRDKEGNWISSAKNVIWTSEKDSVVSVTSGPSDSVIIRGHGVQMDSIYIYATYNSLKCSTCVLYLPYIPPKIRIVQINGNDTSDIEHLTLNLSQDTTLFAVGQRIDNDKWVPIEPKWGIETLITQSNPPHKSYSWNITPKMPGKGFIYISLIGATDSVRFQFGESSVKKQHNLNKQKIVWHQLTNGHSKYLKINFSDPMNNIETSLITVDGRLIAYRKEENANTIILEINNNAKGMYVLRIQSNNEIIYKKVCLIF